MSDLLQRALFTFLALFPILNPPVMAPIFLQLTAQVDQPQQRHLAALIGWYTFLLLSAVLLLGGWLLKLMGISIPVLAIAGGLLVFHSAWGLLNTRPRVPDAHRQDLETRMLHRAFYPLTLPVTAGPGCIAVTLSLVPAGPVYRLETLLGFLGTVLGIAAAAFCVWAFYRFSGPFMRRLGPTGEAAISQISAFVLLAIGVQIVWGGVRQLLLELPFRIS